MNASKTSDKAPTVDDLITRAELILQVFYDRSVNALELLEQDKIEEAIELLRLRNAAFSNLKVVVYLAERSNIDLSKSPQLIALYQKQELIDQQLIPAVNMQKERMEAQAGHLNEVRRKITGYHSGVKEEGTMRHVA
jgi:hypothetical protein